MSHTEMNVIVTLSDKSVDTVVMSDGSRVLLACLLCLLSVDNSVFRKEMGCIDWKQCIICNIGIQGKKRHNE